MCQALSAPNLHMCMCVHTILFSSFLSANIFAHICVEYKKFSKFFLAAAVVNAIFRLTVKLRQTLTMRVFFLPMNPLIRKMSPTGIPRKTRTGETCVLKLETQPKVDINIQIIQ